MPKRTSFPSMFPPATCRAASCGGFADSAKSHTARPPTNNTTITASRMAARARSADHAAECDGERGGQHRDGQHREEIDQRRRILVRVGAVGVEESAAVGSQVLDELERGDGSLRDGLDSALQSVDLRVRRKVERYALPDQGSGCPLAPRAKGPKGARAPGPPKSCPV